MSTTEKFELDARFKEADFIRNMRLIEEAIRREGNTVSQQSKKVNSKKRRRK